MANFAAKINRSIRGRDLGFQDLSSAESGGSNGITRFLAGTVIGLRQDVTNAETTSQNLKAHGLSNLSTASSGVHTIDPPIPGVAKTIVCTGGATEYVKTANSETIESSLGSTFTTLKWVGYGVIDLVGLTTARWLARGLTSGTSSQGQNVTLSTST